MCIPVAQMVMWLPSTVFVGWTVNILMYVTSTPGTHPLLVEPALEGALLELPLDPLLGGPPGKPGTGGITGGGGGGAGAGAGFGAGAFGTDEQGTGVLSSTVNPWSVTLTL